jgi:hypothetical protein
MHNKGQDHGEFLRCFDKQFVLMLRKNVLPPCLGRTEFGWSCWSDCEKGMCPLCSGIGYNWAGIAQSV